MTAFLIPLSAGGNLIAQDRKPGFTLSPVYDSPRSHAPIQLDARLSWSSVDLLVGRLRLEFYVDYRRVHTWVSREVALSEGEMTLSVMAPPALLAEERSTLSVSASFLTDRTVYNLDIHDVTYPVDFKRALTIGIVHPESMSLPPADFTTPFRDRFAWVEPFRLDDALPRPAWARHLTSRTFPVDPALIPDEPLGLLAFDLLILTNAGLEDLDEDQLDALAVWVEAGGSLCAAGGRARSAKEQQFLRRMADSSPINPTIDFDDEGHTRSLHPGNPPWEFTAPGVGRAIVTFGPVDVQTPQWREVVLHLWRVRPEQIANIQETGAWEFAVEQEYWLQDPTFQPLRPASESEALNLQTHLMPDRVEGVPLPTVAILLLACLLAIAPGDYFLLGWLGRRRWTWVLFPTIALGFAVFTVRLAQSHMGQSDHRTTLTVVDLRRDGRIARTSRIELLFAASNKQIEEELADTMAVPMQHRERVRFQGDLSYRRDAARNSSVSPAAVTTSLVTGHVPRSYTHVRELRQWTPRTTRYTTLGPQVDLAVPDFDWSLVDAAALRDSEQRTAILNDLQVRVPAGRIVLLHRDQSWKPDPAPDLSHNSSDGSAVPRPGPDEDPVRFAVALSARPAAGMFHVVSQISPNAAGNLEDLSVFDRTDPAQWLLLVVTRDAEGNLSIFRRLMRERSP